MNLDCDVLIVGAGISGLTTAFRAAREGLRVRVIDASARTGGVIATTREADFLYEHGPNSALDTPEITALVSELGIVGERIDTNALASRRYIVRDGRLCALPSTLFSLLTTRLFSLSTKLNLAREPFARRADGASEETVSQFIERRLGRELLDYAVEPFVAGIYAGNPDELSVRAAFPRLYALEQQYGSLIKGQVLGARERARSSRAGSNRTRSLSFRSGMQTLTDALTQSFRGAIETGARAQRIAQDAGSPLAVQVNTQRGNATLRTRTVVLATPAHSAAPLVRAFAPEASDALAEIPYAPVTSVVTGYAKSDVAHPLDAFGFLAPRAEARQVLGTLFSSSMFAERAPTDAVLLTTFLGGRRNPDVASLDEEASAKLVQDELAALIGVRNTPRLYAVTRWPEAIPQYTLGHLERVDRALAAERVLPGVFLCGSYHGGVSVGDCVRSGLRTAERVAEFVRGRADPIRAADLVGR